MGLFIGVMLDKDINIIILHLHDFFNIFYEHLVKLHELVFNKLALELYCEATHLSEYF